MNANVNHNDRLRRFSDAQISLVIPCFNEEDVLPLLFDRVTAAADSWGASVEIIMVDDGSTDRTWELVSERCRRDPRIRGFRLARNFGHQIALWTGLKQATGQVIAVLDADLQD